MDDGRTIFARVKVPPVLPRFLTLTARRFVPLEDVIAAHLPELFKGLDVLESHVFRVTRARDLEIDEDVTKDLLTSLRAGADATAIRPSAWRSRSRCPTTCSAT